MTLRPFCTCLVLLAALILSVPVAQAQDRSKIGSARLFNNDVLGDGKDRWRSSSYQWGHIRARSDWDGVRPQGFGDIVEYRYRSEIISPSDLITPNVSDRRYAGVRGLGAHTHFERGGFELSTGLDLIFLGDQTGAGDLQKWFHKVIGQPKPSEAILSNQIENALHPTLTFDIAKSFASGDNAIVRPFAEAVMGVEDTFRVGLDYVYGADVQQQLLVRDAVTGTLILGTPAQTVGASYIMGFDFAHVADSAYFPVGAGPSVSDSRHRARIGVDWQGKRFGGYAGLTYLGEEFEGQTEGQILGSVNLNVNF